MINRNVAGRLSGLIATVLVICSSVVSAQEFSNTAIARFKNAVVIVTTYDNRGTPLLQGTGFFIDVDLVATNLHVIKNASQIRVETFGRATSTVTSVLATDEKSDLALLRLDSSFPQSNVLTLKSTAPDEGEVITVISNPQGSQWKVTRGLTGLLWEFHGLGERLQITASVLPGSSGGPVIDAGGEVVGIASMYFNGVENLNFAVPSAKLQELQLKAHNQARLTGFGN